MDCSKEQMRADGDESKHHHQRHKSPQKYRHAPLEYGACHFADARGYYSRLTAWPLALIVTFSGLDLCLFILIIGCDNVRSSNQCIKAGTNDKHTRKT